MDIPIKKILILLLILSMFALLIWLSLKIPELIPEEDKAGTNANYFNFSKDITKELENKDELSPAGRIAKRNLLSPLGERAGILIDKENFNIEYYPPLTNLDERFVVNINSVEFEATKEIVKQWFLSKGFSENDACNLPLAFYPTPDILTNPKDENIPIFNPILDNCD